MKARELIRLLESKGWREVRRKRSRRQYKHPGSPNLVTVADHAGLT